MKLNEFKKKYSSLNHIHKHIVFHTLKQMHHSKKHTSINNAIHHKISEKMKSMNIGYEKLYSLLKKSLNNSVPRKTYESFIGRKYINSGLLLGTCNILNISIDDIDKLKNSLIILSSDNSDIDWLFNSLSKQEQSAIHYLASALFMAEYHPEVFDNYDE